MGDLRGLNGLLLTNTKERGRMRPALIEDRIENDAGHHRTGDDEENNAARTAQQEAQAACAHRLLRDCARLATRGLRENKIMICTSQSFTHDNTFPARIRWIRESQ
jgi:hypothetical protein